ncbi:MAG: type III pantothenate kinase [Pseudomonadota bacterium]
MILIDCGNSQLKAQNREKGRLLASFNIRYVLAWETRFSSWLEAQNASHCCLSSVMAAKQEAVLNAMIASRFGDNTIRVDSQASCLGVTSGYEHPEQLGVDRWMALLAAHRICQSDCMVIDAGSAITLDLLKSDGTHLGGAILAGCNTSETRLREIFHHIDFDDPLIGETEMPGSSTRQAIHINYSLTSLEYLVGLVQRWGNLLGPDQELIITGGDAQRVQRAIDMKNRIVPDLVFQGMYQLART